MINKYAAGAVTALALTFSSLPAAAQPDRADQPDVSADVIGVDDGNLIIDYNCAAGLQIIPDVLVLGQPVNADEGKGESNGDTLDCDGGERTSTIETNPSKPADSGEGGLVIIDFVGETTGEVVSTLTDIVIPEPKAKSNAQGKKPKTCPAKGYYSQDALTFWTKKKWPRTKKNDFTKGGKPYGYGGGSYQNDGRNGTWILPKGSYNEYDINRYNVKDPKKIAGERGETRLVREQSGKLYYTRTHYKSFCFVK